MNFIHGFESLNPILNNDMRMLQALDLNTSHLALAESFLHGDVCADPVLAHEIVKVIYTSGARKYPTLWNKAEQYVNGYEYESLEKLSKGATVSKKCVMNCGVSEGDNRTKAELKLNCDDCEIITK